MNSNTQLRSSERKERKKKQKTIQENVSELQDMSLTARGNKIDKPLARLTNKRRERTNKIKNERGEIKMDTAEIQKYHKRIL